MNLLEQVFTQKLDEIKKIIPDIDVAMNKVKDSFHLMRKNFSKYYQNFTLKQGSPLAFLSEYIMDVYQETKTESTS